MLKIELDDDFIELVAEKIANRAYELIEERMTSNNNLPPILTREEAMAVLKCGPTKMSELMNRPDFPVCREFGVKIPTHLLFKWIETNTRWMENS